MTVRRVAAVLIGLALVASVPVAGFVIVHAYLSETEAEFWGDAPNERPEIQEDLARAVDQAGDGGIIRLADVVPGTWDTVYVWDAYAADPNNVFPDENFGLGATEAETVLAFSHRGKFAFWVRFNVNGTRLLFDLPSGELSASRDGALFRVDGGVLSLVDASPAPTPATQGAASPTGDARSGQKVLAAAAPGSTPAAPSSQPRPSNARSRGDA